MKKDTRKGTLLINCVAPIQWRTMLLSNSMLMARFMTGKGLVGHGRIRPARLPNERRESCAQQRAHARQCVLFYAYKVHQYVPALFRDVSVKNLEMKLHQWWRKKWQNVITIELLLSALFSEECTMQQIVPRPMHISHNETPAEPDDLGCHVVLWRCWYVLYST